MRYTTEQEKKWSGDFGEKYIRRNEFDTAALDREYKKMYGVTARSLGEEFLGELDRDIKILEVGSNIGNQLLLLQKMGFKNLYGIEINPTAVEKAKERTKGVNLIQGSAFDIPFKDKYFDMVFTAGVLIHISPADIQKALKEIYRCSSKYIWGYEYYSDKHEEIGYRGSGEMMWKGDFPGMYTKMFPGTKLVKKRFLDYLDYDNTDVMYMLKRGSR
ncbi:MAG: methyltransferase domain-containing protein [Candidatus Tantalella remota]|nr:methyltransferase domain-containing protein [Candidatus Tantalella remota]